MAISYGDISESRAREVFQSDIKVVSISAPTVSSENGSPIYVTYTLDSDRGTSVASGTDTSPSGSRSIGVDVEYSTNSGTSYSGNCTALTSDPLHSGTTSLTVATTGTSYVFVWDSAVDLSTAYQAATVRVRVRAYDGTAWSPFSESAVFTVDMLPTAPTIVSPDNLYFDSDTTPDFIWAIPTDPGSDRMVFRIEIDDDPEFGSATIDHNSQDNAGTAGQSRFMHKITALPSTKYAANEGTGTVYYIKGLSVTSFTGAATTYASLTDYHSDTAVATTLTNPQIMLVNRADRRCYIPPASITTTQFTIYKSAAGVDTNGIVDLIIYSGAANTFETRWVDLTGISTATAYTYGAGSFATDLMSNSISASITNVRPEILEGTDCGVYISSAGNTGFTLNLSDARIDSTATVRVCLRIDPSEAYLEQSLTVTDTSIGTANNIANITGLTDDTNGGAAWPDYIPGVISTVTHTSDRLLVWSLVNGDGFGGYMSGGGIASSCTAAVHGAADGSYPIWVDVPPLGVSDSYEGGYARYRVTDTLSTGTYFWRVRAGNVS